MWRWVKKWTYGNCHSSETRNLKDENGHFIHNDEDIEIIRRVNEFYRNINAIQIPEDRDQKHEMLAKLMNYLVDHGEFVHAHITFVEVVRAKLVHFAIVDDFWLEDQFYDLFGSSLHDAVSDEEEESSSASQ